MAPQSEPEHGASPDGSGEGESPWSSGLNASVSRSRRVRPLKRRRMKVRHRADASCIKLGGTAKSSSHVDEGCFYFPDTTAVWRNRNV